MGDGHARSDPERDRGLTPKVEIGVLVKIYFVKRRTDEMTQDVLGVGFSWLVCWFVVHFGLDEGGYAP